MSIIPSLELRLTKHKSLKLDNTSTNSNSLVINNIFERDVERTLTPRSLSPLMASIFPPRPDNPKFNNPKESSNDEINDILPGNEVPVVKSPSTEIPEKFKVLLIEYETEILLNDLDLISNIAQRGKNIILRESHLINIIKCLEPLVNDVEIEKELVEYKCHRSPFS
jgi:hypothetical protein